MRVKHPQMSMALLSRPTPMGWRRGFKNESYSWRGRVPPKGEDVGAKLSSRARDALSIVRRRVVFQSEVRVP